MRLTYRLSGSGPHVFTGCYNIIFSGTIDAEIKGFSGRLQAQKRCLSPLTRRSLHIFIKRIHLALDNVCSSFFTYFFKMLNRQKCLQKICFTIQRERERKVTKVNTKSSHGRTSFHQCNMGGRVRVVYITQSGRQQRRGGYIAQLAAKNRCALKKLSINNAQIQF